MKTRSATKCVLLGFVALFIGQTSRAAELDAAGAPEVAKVKAGYLRWIAEFTTWPEGHESGDSIVIGLLGSDPNGVATLIRDKIKGPSGLSAQGRPLQLVDLQLPTATGLDAIAANQLGRCDLLFLSEDGDAQWLEVRELVGRRAIVTVSEIEGFANRRGMIEFVVDEKAGRVLMHINVDAVKRSDLLLSARLLGLKQGVKIIHESGEN